MPDKQPENARAKVREAVIGGAVALALSPIGIWIGFVLNDYLAREKLVIVHIELSALTDTFLIDEDTRSYFRRSEIFEQYSRYESLRYDSALVEAIERNRPVEADQREPMLRDISRLIAFTDEAVGSIAALRDHIDGGRPITQLPPELIISPYIRQLGMLPRIENDEDRGQALAFLAHRYNELRVMNVRALALQAQLGVYSPSRTGQLEITAVVVNQGNTDGLIRGAAELEMVDERHTVDLTAYGTSLDGSRIIPIVMEPVPKRSVTSISFWVDVNRSRVDAAQALAAALHNNNDSRVVIRMKDTRNQPLDSEVYTLPVGAPN